ncbi:DUF3159 domain-containing protein [Lysinimonas soli]|uniref:DUF3159 domain-containing protein n=1 Tax=Lysinimonas soli TaxID=1074233 RepID=A0ABW0NME0_9MICO
MAREPHEDPPAGSGDPDLREAMARAVRRSGLGRVAPDQAPSAATLLLAMGGVRGIVESILPGLLFLVTYTITRNLWLSVAAPVVIALVFIVIRLVRREPITSAIAGALGIVISAVIALLTGRPEDNFVPGFFINGAILLLTVVSLLVRRPLIGVLASLLLSDPEWRADRAQFKVAVIATWFWVALAVIRLGVELPLWAVGDTSALATARLLTGVPLYAVILWLTWLVMRTAWTAPERVEDDGTSS